MMISVNLRPGTKRAKARPSLSAGLDWFKGLRSVVQDPLKAAAVVGWVVVAGFLGWSYFRTGSQLGDLGPRVDQLQGEHQLQVVGASKSPQNPIQEFAGLQLKQNPQNERLLPEQEKPG